MQATLTYNPRDVLEVRAAINHLEAVRDMLNGDKPAGDLTVVNALGQAPQVIRGDDKTDAPAAPRTRKQKPEPVKEDPKPETPAAAEPEQPAASAEPDLDNFGDEPAAETEKEYTHDDVRSAIKASLSKNAANRDKIGAILGKHTTTKQVPDVPKAALAEVVKAIEAL